MSTTRIRQTKTHQMQMVEIENGGRPIEDVLTGLFAELHTIDAVASRLNIHRITLMAWLDNLGAERQTYRVTRVWFPERATAAAAS